jgi:hypothetical protein
VQCGYQDDGDQRFWILGINCIRPMMHIAATSGCNKLQAQAFIG